MKSIRCGRGLGDSLYLQSVARHITQRDATTLRVMSDYPEVFRPLGNAVKVDPFSRTQIDIVAHYVGRKGSPGTTQFEDCCLSAGIHEPVELALNWKPQDGALLARITETDRPIVCVALPRSPMARTDGFGAELLPNCHAIQRAIDALSGIATVVQVGAGTPLHHFKGIDIDLANRTTVAQLLDVASIAHAFLGYCSFLVPLAESFARPALFVWSRAGLRSPRAFIRQVTPQKILHRPTSQAVFDDATDDRIKRAARALLHAVPEPA